MTLIPMKVASDDLSFNASAALKYEASLLPTYTGATEITPSNEKQTIPTANKSVLTDIIINPIPDSGLVIKTGTVEGSGTSQLQIPCEVAPDVIYVAGNLSVDPSLRGVVSITIIKDEELIFTADASTSATTESMSYSAHGITGYNNTDVPHATYSNGVLTIDTVSSSSSYRFNSAITYGYKLVSFGTVQ